MAPVNFYVQKCSGDWLEGKGMKEVEESVRLSVCTEAERVDQVRIQESSL